LFLGIAPILNGGGYYLVDTFITKKGDANNLIRAGVPIHIVLGVAFILLIIGVSLVIKYFYWNGMTPHDSFLQRVMIFGIGMSFYYVLELVYSILFEPENILQEVVALVMIIILAFIVSYASIKFSQVEKYKLSSNIEWRHTSYAVTLGILAIVIPYLYFAS
jgi:hypothetical protein